jgi:acetyl-CoA carboxylase biotin carboxyl carrier protein
MNVKEIIELVDFISKKRLEEVKIETEGIKLSIKKSAASNRVVEQTVVHAAPVAAPTSVPVQAPAPVAIPVAAEATTTPVPASAPQVSDDDKYIAIKSPMIGTFYRSANPESPSLTNIGDKVESGKAVCIIEAMKLFNEIESEVSGTIVKVMVENAQPVEYDQVLFLVDPS